MYLGIKHISEAQIIECPEEMVQGNLNVKVKDGSNPWWAAYQVTNHKLILFRECTIFIWFNKKSHKRK